MIRYPAFKAVVAAIVILAVVSTIAADAQPKADKSVPSFEKNDLAALVHYPEQAKRDGIGGTVLLKVTVSREGRPVRMEVVESPAEILTQAARQAVEGLAFIPAQVDGKTVEAVVTVPVRFRLQSIPSFNEIAPVEKGAEDIPSPYEFNPVEQEPKVDMADVMSRLEYPQIARENGIEGSVVVRVWVSAEGMPSRMAVERSDNPLFDEAAIEAIADTKFEPARRDGKAVGCWLHLPLKFQLFDPVTDEPSKTEKQPDSDNTVEPSLPLSRSIDSQVTYDYISLTAGIDYPENAREMNIEGRVVVKVWITPSGKPDSVSIVFSDNEIFNDAVVDAVLKAEFVPATSNGVAVGTWITIPFNFSLREQY